MRSRDFAYWLQGFFEISGATTITEEQAQVIRNHLNRVFKHEIDPSHGDKAHQQELAKLHEGGGGLTSAPKPDAEYDPFAVLLNC